MSKSFENKKRLKLMITMGTGKFGSSNNDQVILEGFRASVYIEKAGGVQQGTLRAKIYGVSESAMNSVTTLQWKPRSLIPNTIEAFAIDGAAETLVFAGNIVNAWGDYRGMPDVYLHVQAQGGFYNQLKPVNPRSFKGQSDVATVMKQIAEDMGYSFENNGVTTQLTDVYLANTGLEQAKELAKAAGCDFVLDDKTIVITPSGIPRKGLVPLISKETGLVGYPTFDGPGVNFETLFNPAISLLGKIKLETDIPKANGEWVVASLSHNLQSETPGGAWFTTVRGYETALVPTQ